MNKLIQYIISIVIILAPLQAQFPGFRSVSAEERFQEAVSQYNEGRYAVAESIIKKLLNDNSNDVTTAALLLRMKCLYRMEKIETAQQVGRSFLRTFPNSRYVRDIYRTFGDIFIDEGSYNSAFRMYLEARKLFTDQNELPDIDGRILKTVYLNISIPVIDELLALENEDVNRSILLLVKAFGELYIGQPDEGALTLNQIDSYLVPYSFFDLYEQLLLASGRPGSQTATVGVVVPLSGKYQSQGKIFLDGLRQSIRSQNTNRINISFIVHDNHSSDLETIKIMRTLDRNPSVLAIIGPIDEHNAVVAAGVASESKIPLLVPFSVQDQLTEISDYIFQLNSDLETRGRLAARLAVQELGLEHIAVLAPSDSYGHSLTDAFIKELDRMGREVVGIEWYAGIPEDLNRQFKSIRNMAWSLQPEENPYEEFLGMEIDSLDAMFDISAENFFDLPEEKVKPLSRSDSNKIVLDNLDGLYIPIKENHVSYIGTQFPMYNLQTQLIGNEFWQDLTVLNLDNVGPHVNGLVLITDHLIKDFPVPDYEIDDEMMTQYYYKGYDIAQLLVNIFATSQLTRDDLKSRLSSIDEFRANSQYYSFSDERKNLNTGLQVVRYNRNKFSEVGFFKGDSLIYSYYEAP